MAAGDFAPRAWLALLPSPPGPGDAVFLPPDTDPAAEARDASPLTYDAALRTLRPHRALRLMLRLHHAVRPILRRPAALQLLLVSIPTSGLIAASFRLNDGRFGARQLAGGTVALCISFGLPFLYFALSTHRRERSALVGSSPKAARPATLDGNFLAGVVRWQELVGLGRADADAEIGKDAPSVPSPRPVPGSKTPHDFDFLLMDHRSGDQRCPCPLASCAGPLPKDYGARWIAQTAGQYLLWIAFVFFRCYTAFVTFGHELFTSGWCIFALLLLVGIFLWGWSGIMLRFKRVFPGTFRLQNRAVRLSLRSLLARCQGILEASGDGDPLPQPPEEELYIRLHASLSSTWPGIFAATAASQSLFTIFLLSEVVNLVINVAVGSCITAWSIAVILLDLIFFLTDMYHVAEANREVAAVGSLYAAARTELRRLLLLSPSPPRDAAARIGEHLALLDSFADVSKVQARYLGFVVDYGALRTAVVTGLTVLAAFYTLLKGVGVFFTLESFCPG